MKLLVRQHKVPSGLSDKVRVVVNGFSKGNGSRPVISKTITLTNTSMKEVVNLIKAGCGQES